ncbi:mitochondrial inner-membrane-bound regulator-domain-containing protein [Plectosphaerella plurivora]|uniref:Mitochondrial inner-membrane-bound regulator-domain-containing protein n=1 Tax=Plectosphaerella plurivora TaxID=936078 RepID=A0A9P9AIJ1_9PEZI|nr:mitochondrial inner-membrane-bound regulator-domain-containing protein [Plectosphaerella plurivora]
MTSRLAQTGRVCLQCQSRHLSGPRPSSVFQLRQPLTIHHRYARPYSSFDAVWDRIKTASESTKKEPIDVKPLRGRGSPRKNVDNDEPPSERPTGSDARSEKPARRARKGSAESEYTPEVSREKPQEQPQETPKPRGRRGRVGSRRVVLQPENISINMLGQAAHTIVMRDDILAPPRRQIEEGPVIETNPDRAAAEIQAFLEAAEGEPSPEEAFQNIEELRPSAGLIQGDEFWALHHNLCEGFTNRQLSDYIVKRRKKQKGAKPLAAAAPRPRRPWMTSNYSIRPVQRLEVTADMNPKARRALHLMMEEWHLDIWERVEGLSVMEVQVKHPAVAVVLSAGGARNERLSTLRAEYLQPGESLAYVPETKLLSIAARRTIVETIINEIERMTENVGTEPVALLAADEGANRGSFTAVRAVLSQLCSLTNTAFAVEKAGERAVAQARIMWVQGNAPAGDDKLERMGHTVWRLLYTAHSKPESTVVVPRAIGGRLDLDTRHEEKLPWMDRQKSWARWVLPVHREGEDDSSPLEANASSVPALGNSSEAPSVEEALWAPSETSVSTTFGHVLFEAPKDEATADQVIASLSGNEPAAHTLTAVVPPPSGLASLDALLSEDSSTTTIVLRFAAGPDHTTTPLLTVDEDVVGLNPEAAARFTIELHLQVPETIPEDGILTWDSSPRISARAVFETTHSDIVLPDRPVDLRVTRLASSALRDPESIPALREFIDASDLDISTGQLRAPATLSLPTASLPLAPAENDESSTTLEFLGLEVRRAAEFPYQGHSLKYSSIEAGLHGGRRAELSLSMTPGADEADHRQRYLDLAVSLADGQLVRWGDGPQGVESLSDGELDLVGEFFDVQWEDSELADVGLDTTESQVTESDGKEPQDLDPRQ